MEFNKNKELRPKDLKALIQTIDKPYILSNVPLEWDIFKMTLAEWGEQMNRHLGPVTFSSGTTKHSDAPYWERLRDREELTIAEFLERTSQNKSTDRWYSHSYRDISSWPEHLRKSISFEALGFDNTEDILFWLGSKGANTPCHYDTYGFNIVVQVYGRKTWLVFPPESGFTATRVPYEESSVYCKQNFYSPHDFKQFGAVGSNMDAYEIVLNPGDILILPPKWWHYVENLENSLAVNTWIPLEEDSFERLGECFVRMQIDKIVESETYSHGDQLKEFVYNPNEMDGSSIVIMNLFKPLADTVIANSERKKTVDKEEVRRKAQMMRTKHSNVFHQIMPITGARFQQILGKNRRRHSKDFDVRQFLHHKFHDIENVINAVCHPDTIKSASLLYIQQVKSDSGK